MRTYTMYIFSAVLVFLLLGVAFTFQRNSFEKNNSKVIHQHDESQALEVIEMSTEEFIKMNARTPEEVAELREMFGI